MADPHERAQQGYATLKDRFPDLALVPLFNEYVPQVARCRDNFPPTRLGGEAVDIPALTPVVRSVVDRKNFSFLAYVLKTQDSTSEPTSGWPACSSRSANSRRACRLARPRRSYGIRRRAARYSRTRRFDLLKYARRGSTHGRMAHDFIKGPRRMKLARRTFLHLAAGAAALPAGRALHSAQAYPSRPVRFIVPAPPGGALDIIARLMGQWLTNSSARPSSSRTGPAPAPISASRRSCARPRTATRCS